MPRLRALVLCPGRGSYLRPDLGSLRDVSSPALDVFDRVRRERSRPMAMARPEQRLGVVR